MKNAVQELKILKRSDKDVVNCIVSVDGSWLKHGYSSLNCCVTAISIDNGKVSDIEAMSQFSRIYATTSETPYNHACYNLTGSALNMETAYFPGKKKK